jgi:hypothetical protein
MLEQENGLMNNLSKSRDVVTSGKAHISNKDIPENLVTIRTPYGIFRRFIQIKGH